MRKTLAAAIPVLAMIVYMSPIEFAELQGLSNEARRQRLGLPDSCRPSLSAVKVSKRKFGRVGVLVRCLERTKAPTVHPGFQK